MGENADDMIDGLQCSHCGVFFERPHRYPVLCTDCYDSIKTAEEVEELSRATIAEI